MTRKTKHGFYVVDGDSHIGKWCEESGRLDHDQYMLPLVLPYIEPGMTVIDAGANIGDHTIAYAKQVGRTGEVIAFEPGSAAFECLLFNMTDLPEEFGGVSCINAGLGAENGLAAFNPSQNVGASFLSKEGNASTTIFTLDWFMEEGHAGRKVGYIKIDVEGFELDVLKGADSIIRRDRPVLLVEVNRGALTRNGTSEGDLIDHLESLGYELTPIPCVGDQYDVLCKPRQI